MTDQDTSELGQAIQEVSEKASLLVREEIALAKAELTQKLSGLARGAAIGAAAGVFAVFALIYFFHFVALALDALFGVDPWVGYLIVFGVLILLAVVAGFIAARLFRKGTPPTPQMAIEEAQLIKATLTAPHPATPTTATERAEANR
jgi:ABC-type protease/lipase transport system fused ATPase/permease subunit